MQVFQKTLARMGIEDTIGADTDGYPPVFGYRGLRLSELADVQPRQIAGLIENQMMIKCTAELALIRESMKWGHLAHTLLQRYTRVGATETEVSIRADTEATLAMLDAIGPIYRAQSVFSHGASAGYRGQIGRNAAVPHVMASHITFRTGDVLVTGAGTPVWGYHSELERTMIIGPGSDEQKRLFDHMVALQDIALNAMNPGIRCADVDRAVRTYYKKHDLLPFWRHHTGHAIGLRYREGPFLDINDPTDYPRDLESLTLPI
jgi:Xaa-Pro aminopeptidase